MLLLLATTLCISNFSFVIKTTYKDLGLQRIYVKFANDLVYRVTQNVLEFVIAFVTEIDSVDIVGFVDKGVTSIAFVLGFLKVFRATIRTLALRFLKVTAISYVIGAVA